MSKIPENLKYATTHEWVRDEGDGIIAVGITDHAQAALGDLVFVELPEVGAAVSAADESGVVESVKAASDLYSPATGEIVEVNEALADAPETINRDAYGDGWIFKLRVAAAADLDGLLDAAAYQAQLDAEARDD